MARLIARPIEAWPGQLTPDRDRELARFSAPWSDTVDLLDREVQMLGADEVVLQLAISERDCRNDGWIRADAKPKHPGVIVTFDSDAGPLRFSTDRFSGASVWKPGGTQRTPGWQCNVRAVALALEALRKVDRYGIGSGREQYVGWNALPPGQSTAMGPARMTADAAARLLAEHAASSEAMVAGLTAKLLTGGGDGVRLAYRVAAKRHHPDAGGDPETFRRLTEARDLLLGGA